MYKKRKKKKCKINFKNYKASCCTYSNTMHIILVFLHTFYYYVGKIIYIVLLIILHIEHSFNRRL